MNWTMNNTLNYSKIESTAVGFNLSAAIEAVFVTEGGS